MLRPSGLNASDITPASRILTLRVSRPVVRSNHFTSPTRLSVREQYAPAARIFPPGLNTTVATSPAKPPSRRSILPEAMSQRRTSPEGPRKRPRQAVASILPSGLNAIDVTVPGSVLAGTAGLAFGERKAQRARCAHSRIGDRKPDLRLVNASRVGESD